MATPTPNAVLLQRIEVAPGLAIFKIAPDGWNLPPFTPGQFAVLGLPASAARTPLSDPEEPGLDSGRFIRRAYSIASSSLAKDHLELFVNIVRSGELTPRLFALSPGDKLWLGPKLTGMFTLREVPREANIVMIATGTGLAPYMSMLRTELDAGGPRRFAVLHGARHSWDLAYSSELYTMQRLRPGFAYLPTVSRPDGEPAPWGGARGHVQALWDSGAVARAWGAPPSAKDTHVFLCGHPGMIEGMTKVLEGEGYRLHAPREPGEIHVEKYW